VLQNGTYGEEEDMESEPRRNDFIGFILAAERDEKLMSEFLSQTSVDKLWAFFQEHTFTGIPKHPDCDDILKAKSNVELLHIDALGVRCPSHTKY
jgi:hypothetical protein